MEADNRLLDWNWKKSCWWWQFGCNDESTPELVTKFSWEVKTRSIKETENSSMCFGSLMVCVRPYWPIKSFKIDPSNRCFPGQTIVYF